MDPEEHMEWVNEFMETMARQVQACGGVVDDYFGDGLKANFGVPFPRETEAEVARDARAAVRCALSMARALEELDTHYRERQLPTVAMRVGIDTGPVVAGSLGSAERLKYTTLGDVVVTAQRMQSLEGIEHDFEKFPARILVSERTHAHLDDSYRCESLGVVLGEGEGRADRDSPGSRVDPDSRTRTGFKRRIGMKFEHIAVVVLALALVAGAAAAKEEKKSPSNPTESAKAEKAKIAPVESAPPNMPVYYPPKRGKPRARIGGGVRGVDHMWPSLFTLVPDHVGRTIADQPSLFWYVDSLPEPDVEIVFTLMEEDGIEPLIEKRLPRPARAGIQRLDLAAFGAKLEAGRSYEWFVALVVDPEQRGRDIVTAGWIDRVEAPSGLAATSGAPSVEAYAEHSLWYDALAAAADGVRAAPEDPEARRTRDALLLQVGLGAAVRSR